MGPQGPSGAFTPEGTDASFIGGNVGIGTSSPRAKLHVEGGDLLAGAPGEEWLFHTRSVRGGDFLHITDMDNGELNFEGGLVVHENGNVGIGTTAPASRLEVEGNTRINGRLSINGPAYSVNTLVVRARPGETRPFWIGDASEQGIFMIDSGTPNSLIMVGHASKTEGGTSWLVFSDRRLKQDVQAYEPGLNEVLRLRPVRFRYRDDAKRSLTSAQEEVGFIAQEVREVIPEAVTEGKDGYLSLSADPIHWAAINAIQELNARLEAETAALGSAMQVKDAELQDLKRQLAELTTLVHGLAPANGGAR
jgi:hypothetical protein